MNNPSQARWYKLWRDAGAQADLLPQYGQLIELYSQPHRHYHNSSHIFDCLQEFDLVRHLATEPNALEIAIWFHDAIYDSHASDNEERSASLAEQTIIEAGLGRGVSDSVKQLVLATKSHEVAGHVDAPLLVDIDLSILGRPAAWFWEYEKQIRQEYVWVPANVFAPKRAEILQRFLSRDYLYSTKYFREKFEDAARQNLQASIRKLREG